MQKLGILKNVELVCISGAILFLLIVSVAPEVLIADNNKINDVNVLRNKYQIIHIRDLPSTNEISANDKNRVITYQQRQEQQQQQTTNYDKENSNQETRFIEIELKGFNHVSNKSPVYLFLTPYNDSCQKSAFFPEWKIDNGTSNGVLRLKINFNKRLKESHDLYFCVRNEGIIPNEIQHLGEKLVLKTHEILR